MRLRIAIWTVKMISFTIFFPIYEIFMNPCKYCIHQILYLVENKTIRKIKLESFWLIKSLVIPFLVIDFWKLLIKKFKKKYKRTVILSFAKLIICSASSQIVSILIKKFTNTEHRKNSWNTVNTPIISTEYHTADLNKIESDCSTLRITKFCGTYKYSRFKVLVTRTIPTYKQKMYLMSAN